MERVISSPAITRIGGLCYRYRQHLSMALLAVSIVAARPLTAGARLNAILDAMAFTLVLVGGGIRSWAMGYHVWRRVHGPGSQRSLITAGPYALVRNPLYLGTLLISGGVALMSGSWPIMIMYAVVFWPGYHAIIRWEEGRLDAQFGERYRGYFETIPRLLPAGRIWPNREGAFSLDTMLRCMEPVKTLGFVAALALMLYVKSLRAPL